MIDGLREMILIPVKRILFNVKLGLKDQNIAEQRTNIQFYWYINNIKSLSRYNWHTVKETWTYKLNCKFVIIHIEQLRWWKPVPFPCGKSFCSTTDDNDQKLMMWKYSMSSNYADDNLNVSSLHGTLLFGQLWSKLILIVKVPANIVTYIYFTYLLN